ncbi:hypothetical protein A2U01_0065958, partial [Trifolium medium]|nr:hypothetical protein [Trifolium medium]
ALIYEPEHKLGFVEDANFDARSKDYIPDEEKTVEKPLPLEIIMKFHRHTPYGHFINIQLDNNPSRTVKIGANLPYTWEKAW